MVGADDRTDGAGTRFDRGPFVSGRTDSDNPEDNAEAGLSENGSRVLVMTVGTGDVNRLEKTLFAPLRKSIATDAWTQVVLLPSKVTEEFAETVRKGIRGVEVAVEPLPEGDENDADQAYAHFDSVLDKALRKTPAEAVVVDFTRGTKAMSAALVLAAARHEIPRLRYITGRRDGRGMVIPGTEDIRGIRATVGAGHRRLDLALGLMRRGSFHGAEAVLSDMDHPSSALYPDDLIETATAVRTATRFYAAWDRLDYDAASRVDVGGPPDGDWKGLWPTSAAREWVAALAKAAERKELRRLIVDLLANGERRLRQGQHEDALVRAYRVLELIGQARLFDHDLDSGSLDPDHAAVKAAVEKITKRKQDPLGSGRDGRLQAGRFQVARILEALEDPLAKRLLQFDDKSPLKPTRRNKSLLIHGFTVGAPGEPETLRRLFDELVELAREDGDANVVDDWLSVARTPAFAAN